MNCRELEQYPQKKSSYVCGWCTRYFGCFCLLLLRFCAFSFITDHFAHMLLVFYGMIYLFEVITVYNKSRIFEFAIFLFSVLSLSMKEWVIWISILLLKKHVPLSKSIHSACPLHDTLFYFKVISKCLHVIHHTARGSNFWFAYLLINIKIRTKKKFGVLLNPPCTCARCHAFEYAHVRDIQPVHQLGPAVSMT